MKSNYQAIKYLNLKSAGLTLLELIITICITSIILAGSASFVSTSVKIMNKANLITIPNNNPQVAINILTQDFLANKGNINISNNNTTTTLNFDIAALGNTTHNTVYYICNYHTKQFYRQLDLATPELLIDQINSCDFTTNVATNLLNVTLFTKIIFTLQDKSNTLYEVINAPYNA